MAAPRRNDLLIPSLGVLFDAVAIECAFLLSYWLRFNTPVLRFLPLMEQTPPLNAYVGSSLVVIPLWLLIFKSGGMYGARRNVEPTDEFFQIVKFVTLGMLFVMSAAFFYRTFSYSRVVFVLLWISSVCTIGLDRLMLVRVERMLYRMGKELRNAVVVGCSATANKIYGIFRDHPLLGYRLAGYFADTQSSGDQPLASAAYLGTLADAPQRIVDEQIELALIAVNPEEHAKLFALVEECEGVNVEFMMVPDVLDLMTSSVSVKEIEGVPFLRLKSIPMTTWGRIMKRTFDLIVSLALLTVLSPLFLVIALLIKLDSRGPAFFRQERVGFDGGRFSMVKFRSMQPGAESESGPVFARSDDPRRTTIGSILRKTSLDELPQLWNVLKGEMSLVGPRPERPYFVDQFKALVPRYLERHRVKTGMTGWAQVNGLRGNTSIEQRINYDVYYVEHWSFWFDLKILLKTIRALFPAKHVY